MKFDTNCVIYLVKNNTNWVVQLSKMCSNTKFEGAFQRIYFDREVTLWVYESDEDKKIKYYSYTPLDKKMEAQLLALFEHHIDQFVEIVTDENGDDRHYHKPGSVWTTLQSLKHHGDFVTNIQIVFYFPQLSTDDTAGPPKDIFDKVPQRIMNRDGVIGK